MDAPIDDNLNPSRVAELQKILQSHQEINGMVNRGVVSMKTLLELVQDWEARLSNANAYLEIAKDLLGTINRKAMEGAEIDKLKEKGKRDLTSLYDAEIQAQSDLVLKQAMVNTGLRDEYAQLLATYMLENKIKDVTDPTLKNLIEQLKHRQKHTDHLKEEVELYEHIAKYQLEIREELEKYTMGWKKAKGTIEAIFKDPAFAKGAFLVSAIASAEKLTHSMHEFMNAGMTAGEGVAATFQTLSVTSVMGLNKSNEVLTDMVQEYGSMNVLSKEQLTNVGYLASKYGIAGGEAAKLTMSISRMPGETKQTAANFDKIVTAAAKSKGVMPSQVMKEMAKNTGTMAMFSKGGADGFARAAAQAKKMGIEVSSMAKAAEGLLDIETSLAKEMEASAMLGRQINLDRARQLALAGDLEGAQKEILRAVGGAAEFDRMNVLQKRALADAVGLSVEELQKAAKAQQEGTASSEEQAGVMSNVLGTTLKVTEGLFSGFGKIMPMLVSISSLMSIMGATSMKQLALGLASATVQAGALLLKMITLGKVDLTKGAKGLGTSFADKRKLVEQRQAAGGGLTPKVKTPATPGGAGPTDQASKVGKLKVGDMLKGAAALLIVSAALFVAAKAFQEFAEVKWEDVALGVGGIIGLAVATKIIAKGSNDMIKGAVAVAILGYALRPFAESMSLIAGLDIKAVLAAAAGLVIFAGAVFGLGALMMVPGAQLLFGAGIIAMIALGAALIFLGAGLEAVSAPMQLFAKSLMDLTKGVDGDQLLKVGGGLSLLALGMIGLGYAASVAIPAVAALALLGVGLYIVGGALEKVASSLTPISTALTNISKLNTDQLQKVGDGLLHIAKGLGAIGLSGIAAIPALTALSRIGKLPQITPITSTAPVPTSPPPASPTPTTTKPTTTQATTTTTDAKIDTLITTMNNFLTAFRKKDISLVLDSKTLHRVLFDENYGGKTATNRS